LTENVDNQTIAYYEQKILWKSMGSKNCLVTDIL